ncbi:hypothetical protein BpHYR1_039738 [Brachionus plicatilis]|uniref:Uncharacterized protein n=1 Tax=Brachionus plicatilis TaxID=10195 RepID=A0A3M7T5Z4_BRAPC|nr:hypothetical protein BpHYR1_039738 [Brachionus plicatilis]
MLLQEIVKHDKKNINSGFQWPTGGSGGIGAPSHNKGSTCTGISFGNFFLIISAVSTARTIVE